MRQLSVGPLSLRQHTTCTVHKYRYRSSIQVGRQSVNARTGQVPLIKRNVTEVVLAMLRSLPAQEKACIALWASYKAERITRTQVCASFSVLI